MENPKFGGRVFVTTTAKAQAVKNLLDYWTMKTDLLRQKDDPKVFTNKAVQQKTRGYLLEHSNLQEQHFWNSMDQETQEAAMKCFTMQEVPVAKKEIVQKNRMKAMVYVCLSGFATVKNLKTETEVRFGPGQIFGNIDLFNKIVQKGEALVDGHPDDAGVAENLINFGEGTFMRMELKDLFNTVLKPDEETLAQEEEAKKKVEAVAVSGIAWEDMTEDDKFYVKVYLRTKELVNKRFFSFLDSYRIVPKNSHMPSFKYYNEGNATREIYLDEKEQPWVFIIIVGAVKVELCTTGPGAAVHTISCVRTGNDETLHIKVSSSSVKTLCSLLSLFSRFANSINLRFLVVLFSIGLLFVTLFLVVCYCYCYTGSHDAFDASFLWFRAVHSTRMLHASKESNG